MRSSAPASVWLIWGMLLSLQVLLFGCESKPPRYPEDHARFERLVEAVEALRRAYEEKDNESLRELMLPIEGLQRLELEIQKDFRAYQVIDLDFTIERMTVKGGRASVNVRWEGEWSRQPGDVPISGQGHGVLVWSGKQVVLLADVGGDLPFGMATRESLL